MADKYHMRQNIVYKALISPVLYFGLPLGLLFVVTAGPFVLGLYTTPKIWLVIPVLVFFLGLLTKKDPFFFHLLYLKWKTTWSMNFRFKDESRLPVLDKEARNAARANRLMGCQVVFGCKYTSNSKIGVSRVTSRLRRNEL